jgi:hypothetical protein
VIKNLFLSLMLLGGITSSVVAESNFPNGFPAGLTVRGVPILNSYPGKVWWVDDSGSDGNAGDFERPFGTLDYAIGRCVADRGDIILVKPGYVGTISSAGAVDIDVAGVAIVGLGAGSNRPTLQWGSSTADVDIDAANVTLKNFYLNGRGYATVSAMIDVNASYFTIEDCEFLLGLSTSTGIDVGANCTSTACLNLKCITYAEVGADSFIHLGGTNTGFIAKGLWVNGNFGSGTVFNPTNVTCNDLLIQDCFLRNSKTGVIPLDLNGTGTGFLIGNMYSSDVGSSTSVDPGGCLSYECYTARTNDVSAVLAPTTTSN